METAPGLIEQVNQHSAALVPVFVLFAAYVVLRRRRWIRRAFLMGAVPLIAIGFLLLRPGAGDARPIDAVLGEDRPVVVHFFSNY